MNTVHNKHRYFAKMHYSYNIKLSSTFKKKKGQHLRHGIVTPSLRTSALVHLGWQQRGRRRRRDECGYAHIYGLIRTTDVCTSLGCIIGMHC